jgi:membrane protein involved in colicin uptake
VLATGGVQVHLPLVPAQPVHSGSAPEATEAPAAPEVAQPAKKPWPWVKADQSAADAAADEAAAAKADKPKWRKAKAERVADDVAEVEPKAPRVSIDRTVLLVGAVAGFVGGGVSGAAVTLLLS